MQHFCIFFVNKRFRHDDNVIRNVVITESNYHSTSVNWPSCNWLDYVLSSPYAWIACFITLKLIKEEAYSPFPKCRPLRQPRHLIRLGFSSFRRIVSFAHLFLLQVYVFWACLRSIVWKEVFEMLYSMIYCDVFA